MKKFHISIAVKDLFESIKDYSNRLGCDPEIVVDEKYALWRTDILNFSISQKPDIAGQMRHLGFEDSSATEFSISKDCNGTMWEDFTSKMQKQEIIDVYGDTN
jgi:hypothetical protein